MPNSSWTCYIKRTTQTLKHQLKRIQPEKARMLPNKKNLKRKPQQTKSRNMKRSIENSSQRSVHELSIPYFPFILHDISLATTQSLHQTNLKCDIFCFIKCRLLVIYQCEDFCTVCGLQHSLPLVTERYVSLLSLTTMLHIA
mmetsp:Transcript_15837/g.39035  ORF Transcript_15837/g.39035 Transcript_15837/m.39035 type:complete len:142 (+) Transcript_15837:795-1220(+)